jgi:predicted AAA+ superfamily ATPase
MISRILQSKIAEYFNYFPVITLTGPRQSGKTTLLKHLFKDFPYLSLETPDVLARAEEDPKLFLEKYKNGVILDEVQRVPALFSYIQTIVDEFPDRKFVLSGSQNFLMLEKVSQTLAGRTAVLKLLPFSLEELKNTTFEPQNVNTFILKGGYPRLYDKKIPPSVYYPNYLQTYIERDVRSIQNIENLSLFTKFLQLCAGRVGQLLNMSALATEMGISVNTAKNWLSVLEAGFVVYTLQPYHKNYNKRLVKTPKLYFYDTGLASFLLNIKTEEMLETHYAKGSLFENMVINEYVKHAYNQGEIPHLYFWRDNHGVEIDLLVAQDDQLLPIEIKAGTTYHKDFFKNLTTFNQFSQDGGTRNTVIYAGDTTEQVSKGKLVSWRENIK